MIELLKIMESSNILKNKNNQFRMKNFMASVFPFSIYIRGFIVFTGLFSISYVLNYQDHIPKCRLDRGNFTSGVRYAYNSFREPFFPKHAS